MQSQPSAVELRCPVEPVNEAFLHVPNSLQVCVFRRVRSVQHCQLTHAGNGVLDEILRKFSRVLDSMCVATAKAEVNMNILEPTRNRRKNGTLCRQWNNLLVLRGPFALRFIQSFFEVRPRF